MSFTLAGGASGALQEVDATPLAARAILYDSLGNVLQPTEVYSGIGIINVRQSAATALGAATWGIYNPSTTKIVRIKKINLQLFFDGVAAATLMKYELIKMTGITTFSGGVLVTPSHKITSQAGVVSAVIRVLDTGLTTTGGTAQAQAWLGAQGRVTQTATIFNSTQFEPIVGTATGSLVAVNIQLAQNEALILRQFATSVIGDNVLGACEFSEVAV